MSGKMHRNPVERLKDRIPQETWRALYTAATREEKMEAVKLPKQKRYLEGTTKDVDEKKGIVVSMITTNNLDRDGDVIASGAFSDSIDAYMKNPVVLWAHQHSSPPIGQAIEMRERKKGIQAVTQFARDESEFADRIFRLYAGEYLRAWSVGFIPLTTSEEPEDMVAGQKWPTITRAELYEYSAVPVPSNREALTNLVKGLMDSPEPEIEEGRPMIKTIPRTESRELGVLRRQTAAGLSELLAEIASSVGGIALR